MKLITRVLQTQKIGFSQVFKQFSTYNRSPGTYGVRKSNSIESADVSEVQMFGDHSGNGEISDSFFSKLDSVKNARNTYSASYGPTKSDAGFGPSTNSNAEGRFEFSNDLDATFTTTLDGMDEKLKDAVNYFEVNLEEIENDENYSYRPDVNFEEGMTYTPQDLNLRKPGVQKPIKRIEFETTTEEVLQKADFRNVWFLSNFLTDSGIMHKRSKTGISAKAQRKVAREIKTARAFGLLPFTTMGTKPFRYGKTMEDSSKDFEGETSYRPRSFVDTRRTL